MTLTLYNTLLQLMSHTYGYHEIPLPSLSYWSVDYEFIKKEIMLGGADLITWVEYSKGLGAFSEGRN